METRTPKTVFVAVLALLTAASFAGAVACAQSPAARPDSNLGSQRDFNVGSGITLSGLTPVQTANLANLGQVWGFLKYHHPKVTSGRLQWDHELFRVMPAVLAATDRAAASAVLQQWIQRMGELKPGRHAPLKEADLHLRPDTTWFENEELFGSELCRLLRAVYAARPGSRAQHYVSLVASVANPEFTHESDYPQIKLPDAGYQLLALFRFWNVVRYWFPYRNLIGEDWTAVLSEFIPRLAFASDATAYQLELFALIARAHDTHANLWSSLGVRPPVGDSQLPAIFRFIEGRLVVSALLDVRGGENGVLQRGDIITAIGGQSIEELVARWSPYYAASNETTRLRDIARFVGRGGPGPVRLALQRAGEPLELDAMRVSSKSLPDTGRRTHDLPGPAFRLLSKDVAYLKLSSVRAAEAGSYVEKAAGTKGWVFDIRNYPSEFVVFALGAHLVSAPTHFACFTNANLEHPGAFSFGKTVTLQPAWPHYAGRIVLLVDEVTQSQAEYTAMAFRAAPRAMVVGSTTAAADGNVSRLPLPGGLRTMVSGIGVFYPNKRPTQRIGIQPDIEVRPTIAGIAAGRDEVLAEALRQIRRPSAPTAK